MQKYYILQADAQGPNDQEPVSKYLAYYYSQSGGSPWCPNNLSSAFLHNKLEQVECEVERMMKATHTTFDCGPTAASNSHNIPTKLSSMFSSELVDGVYRGRLRIVEVQGTWAELQHTVIKDVSFAATRYCDTPGKMPAINWTYNTNN